MKTMKHYRNAGQTGPGIAAAMLAAAIVSIVGCAEPTGQARRPSVPKPVQGQWQPAVSTQVQVSTESLGGLPNSGLLLPAVSADGQFLAYLQMHPGQTAYPDALIDGKELQAVALMLRPAKGPADKATQVCPAGACWMSWLGSKRLAFVKYGQNGRCELGTYDVAAGQTRYTAVGLRTMLMLSASPDGDRLALAGTQAGSERLGVFVLDVANARLLAAPPGKSVWQLWPFWLGQDEVLFVAREDTGISRLCRWKLQSELVEPLVEIAAPASPEECLSLFAGLPSPLNPGRSQLAFYDPSADAIAALDVQRQTARVLASQAQAGCWLGEQLFIAAGQTEMSAVRPGGQPVRLMRGPWLPRWSNASTKEILACTRSDQPGMFELARLRVQAGNANNPKPR